MATERRLFGTDGVRGEAGTFLTAELATALGEASASVAGRRAPAGPDRPRHPRVGADARGGAGRRGRRGGRRRAARRGPADAGGSDPGQAPRPRPRRRRLRLPQPLRRQRDQVLLGLRHQARRRGRGADRGAVGRRRGARRPRSGARAERRPRRLPARALEAAFPLDLSGRRVVLDCANGATHRAAPAIFERLGAEVETIAVEPDGRNINDGCGSTHLEPPGRATSSRPGRRSASPSTATATACSRSTAAAASTTATS